ncbi:hypothetical protein B0H10DRAFT_2104987 [Mycena sp. CBHHK59/15]|nr:hypothetical protein B0H10DRAFT_2104987 [Mycena sp. CBHHK59/15]
MWMEEEEATRAVSVSAYERQGKWWQRAGTGLPSTSTQRGEAARAASASVWGPVQGAAPQSTWMGGVW